MCSIAVLLERMFGTVQSSCSLVLLDDLAAGAVVKLRWLVVVGGYCYYFVTPEATSCKGHFSLKGYRYVRDVGGMVCMHATWVVGGIWF
jgi:hypothetical protein